jgi:hypothetical protein
MPGSRLLALAFAVPALALGGCGGGSSEAKVGDCIDASKKVVDCSDASAKQKLVTDQEKKNAIACIEIGDVPQKQVTVNNHDFCAEPK